jgi:hypothetical protein
VDWSAQQGDRAADNDSFGEGVNIDHSFGKGLRSF